MLGTGNWALKAHGSKLIARNWQLVEDLPLRAGACRYAQSIWARESQSREEAQKEWNAKSPDAFNLRDELVHHFLFAFRKQPELVNKVQIIREGGSNADMLQDLSDLSVLGKENLELLKAIGLEAKILNEAALQSNDLAVVLANSNGAAGNDADAKELHDKAYSYMKLADDEIRTTVQYSFWRDEDRKSGYVSIYFKRKNQSKKRINKLINSMKGGAAFGGITLFSRDPGYTKTYL